MPDEADFDWKAQAYRQAYDDAWANEVKDHQNHETPAVVTGDPEQSSLISTYERLAYRQAKRFRLQSYVAFGFAAVCLTLVGYVFAQWHTSFKLVGFDSLGHVRIVDLPDGWTVDTLTIRNVLAQYIQWSRNFGIDEKKIGQERQKAWYMTDAKAQPWLTNHFMTERPMKHLGLQMVEVKSVRIVPPTDGRTWEVFWDEEWTSGRTRTTEIRRFRALMTLRVVNPQGNEAAAEHFGIWVELVQSEPRES